jgi:hypothetical protein
MSPIDPEELLRPLAEIEEREAGSPLGDEILASWRAGELPEAERERVEILLGHSPAARKRLARLAGLRLPEPPARVREAVLASFRPARPAPGPLRRAWWWAAAAALALALSFPLLRPGQPRGPSHGAGSLPVYELALGGGQAQVRSVPRNPGKSREVAASPDQRITLAITAVDGGKAGVEFGLFRLAGSKLERLDDDRPFAVERDAATFAGEARALAGAVPGRYPLLAVAAWPEDMPADGSAVAGHDPQAVAAALTAGERRRVFILYLTILDPSALGPKGERP